jgi:hypothetical protein
MMRELKPIEAVHLDQVEAASLLNAQFNDLLNSYNDLVPTAPSSFLLQNATPRVSQARPDRRSTC